MHKNLRIDAAHHMNCIIGDEIKRGVMFQESGNIFLFRVSPPHLLLLCSEIRCVEVLELCGL